MADCERIKELMMMQIDNEISDENKFILDEHLAFCESCKQELDSLALMISELNSMEEVELPHNFHAETMEKIRNSGSKLFNINKPGIWRQNWRQYSSVAAVFLLVFMLISSATVGIDLLFSNMKNVAVRDAATAAPMVQSAATAAPSVSSPQSAPEAPMTGAMMKMDGDAAMTDSTTGETGDVREKSALQAPMQSSANAGDDIPISSGYYIPDEPAPTAVTFSDAGDAALGVPNNAPAPIAPSSVEEESVPMPTAVDMNSAGLSFNGGGADESPNADMSDVVTPMTAQDVTPPASQLQKSLMTADYGSDEKNVKYYNISIEVDDLNVALQSINTLSGYTISSEVQQADERNGYARITQAVDDAQFYGTIYVLKNLGEVTNESQGQYSVLVASKDAYSHYIMKLEEKNRLMELFAKTEEGNMLVVSDRINAVINEMDDYQNQINSYNASANSPTIQIELTQKYVLEKAPVVQASFGEKVRETFGQSVYAVVTVSRAVMSLFSFILVPALVVGAIAAVGLWVMKKLRR